MTDKLTDKEVVKALECRVKDKCPECPYFHSYPCDKCRNMQTDALDLINRLQAKVEKCEKVEHFADKTIATLQAENERLGKELILARESKLLSVYDNAKSEAYKECIEKAKNEIDSQSHSRSLEASGERFRIHKILDNLLKELVGENGYRTFNENSCS